MDLYYLCFRQYIQYLVQIWYYLCLRQYIQYLVQIVLNIFIYNKHTFNIHTLNNRWIGLEAEAYKNPLQILQSISCHPIRNNVTK